MNYLSVLFFTYCRLSEFVSNKHNVDDHNDVTGVTSAAERQHFSRRQRTTSTVPIKSSGQITRSLYDFKFYSLNFVFRFST